MKHILLVCLLFISLSAIAQDVQRVVVDGKIKVPSGEDVEEISIYNISSEKGTVTNTEGEFQLAIADNDRLIITALQFKSLELIVTEEDVRSKTLLIYLNPNVYKLGAVIIRSTDLSGFAELDAKTVGYSVYVPGWDLSYEVLEFGYNFENDGQTRATGHAADEALNVNTVPVASVDVVEVVNLFFPKKKKTPKEIFESKKLAARILAERYTQDYFAQTFGLPQERVNDFVYYSEENGLTLSMMREENEIELMEFLLQRSLEYKKRISSGG